MNSKFTGATKPTVQPKSFAGTKSSKPSKILLSMAAIALLSSAAVAEELKYDASANKLQLGTNAVTITNGKANVAPSETDATSPVAVKTTISNTIGSNTLTQLDISASQAAVNIGTASNANAVKLGGSTPTGGTAATDGYGVSINAKSVALAGKDASNNTELNINSNGSITTTDGTTVGANSSINVAKGVNLSVGGGLDHER